MALFHPQYVVKPYFLPAPLHQKAVDVEQEDYRKQSDYDSAQSHDQAYVLRSDQLLQSRVGGQEPDDVEHGDDAY